MGGSINGGVLAVRVENNLLDHILGITKPISALDPPLADRLSVIDRKTAGEISRFLSCYRSGRYALPIRMPDDEEWRRTATAAAEATHAAFVAAFGRGPFGRYDLERSKGEILAVLTYLDSWLPKKKKLLERAERFFCVWREAAEKHLAAIRAKDADLRDENDWLEGMALH